MFKKALRSVCLIRSYTYHKDKCSQLPVVAQFISALFQDTLCAVKDGGQRKMEIYPKQLAHREKITEESQA